jgi:hypothetical protein
MRKTTPILTLCGLLIGGLAAAAPPKEFKSAYEVHKYVDESYNGDNSSMKLTLILTNKRKEKRKRSLTRYRVEKIPRKTVLCWVFPADLRGTATLTLEVEGKDDIQRIYLPAMKKIRKIASGDKGKSWAGTDFTFEDLQEQDLDDFNYSELKTVKLGDQECYYYSITPKTEDKSCYGKIVNWIRKDIMKPMRAAYYDKKGTFYKELQFRDYKKVQDIWTACRLLMIDHREKHQTDFLVDRIVYNRKLDEKIFSTQGMLDVPENF